VIVADASAAVSALLNAGQARQALATEQVHVPHLIDAELASALRRLVTRRFLDVGAGWAALQTWSILGGTRHPLPGLIERVWQLRDDLTAYDAAYVALAEALGCAVVTADAGLSRAPGLRCPVTVVPR
jgi:predicted nucleic acid-binding protein